jgi:hypothetical protein
MKKGNVKTKLVSMVFLLLIFCLGQAFAGACGDVNSDGAVTIVDGLLIAQYYVDLNPVNFDPTAADVDGDGDIDIVDALLVARYYVELITEFPGCSGTPEPTDEPLQTPDPTDPPQVIDCSNAPVWTADAVYDTAGTRVQYNGNLYENNWYSSGQNPEENSGEHEVWSLIGSCNGEMTPAPTAIPDTTTIFLDDLLPTYNDDFNQSVAAAIDQLDGTGGTMYLNGEGEGANNGVYQMKSKAGIYRQNSSSKEIVLTTRNGRLAEVRQETSWHIVHMTETKNLRLENLKVVGTTGFVGHGIRISNCENITLDGVEIHNAPGYAIGVQSGTQFTRNLRIYNSKLINNNDGIDIKGQREDGSPLVYIDGLEMTQSQGTCLDLRGYVSVKNVTLRISGSAVGLKFRLGDDIGTNDTASNGWAGYGTAENIEVFGEDSSRGIYIESGRVHVTNARTSGQFSPPYILYDMANKDEPVILENCYINGTPIESESHFQSLGGLNVHGREIIYR